MIYRCYLLVYILIFFFSFSDYNVLIDVIFFYKNIIGLLHEIVKTTPIGTGKKPCTNIVLKDKRYYFLICQHQMVGFCISLIITWKMSFLMQWEYGWCNTIGNIPRSFIIYHLFTLSSLLPFCSQWQPKYM